MSPHIVFQRGVLCQDPGFIENSAGGIGVIITEIRFLKNKKRGGGNERKIASFLSASLGGLAGVRDALRRSQLPAAAFPAERSADTGATCAPISSTARSSQGMGKSASDTAKSCKRF